MTDNVTFLPVWKKDATPEERFLELAQMARENPERFERVIIGWMGEHQGKPRTFNYVTSGCDALAAVGLATLIRRKVEDWNIKE